MKQLYDLGITLTFFLLCINGVYMITGDLIPNHMPALAKDIDSMDVEAIDSLTAVNPDIDRQQWSSARADDYRKREQGLDKLIFQMVFGWSTLINGILQPYGLEIIGTVLTYILAPIQLVSMGYLAMLTLTALRGGFST